MEQRKSERDPADAARTRQGSRFPISPVGWMGIAAAIVGLAYFVLPQDAPEQASERKPPPATAEPRKVRATASGPPTLYIHVRDDMQRKWAERMVVPLAQRGIHVAGIKVVATGPSTRDLRYVGSVDPADAADVAQALREVGVSTQRVRRTDAAEGRPSQHYELWLPPGRVEPPS
jgi:hypothetical protein